MKPHRLLGILRSAAPSGTSSWIGASVSDRPGGEHVWLGRRLLRFRAVAFATAFLLAWVCAAGAAAATLNVNTTTDETTSGDQLCSLREAIAAANSPGTPSDCGIASSVSNTIVLGAGTYTLSIAPAGTDDNATGDLNVTGTAPLAIVGVGKSATVIDATGLGDRVLSIAAGASVTLRGLEITGGHAPDGAAGASGSGGNGSDAGSTGAGGGIYNAGALSLIGVEVLDNTAGAGGAGGSLFEMCKCGRAGSGGGGGDGGGIYNAGALNVTGSAILTNDAGGGGGGGYGASGKPGYAGPQGGAGGAGGAGGGIFDAGGAATLTVSNSTIDGNREATAEPEGPVTSRSAVAVLGAALVAESQAKTGHLS